MELNKSERKCALCGRHIPRKKKAKTCSRACDAELRAARARRQLGEAMRKKQNGDRSTTQPKEAIQ